MSQVIRINRHGDIIPTGRASLDRQGRVLFRQEPTTDIRTYTFIWDNETSVSASLTASNCTAVAAATANTVTLTVSNADDRAEIDLTLVGATETRLIEIVVNAPETRERDYRCYGS